MSRYLVFNTHQPQRVRNPIELILYPILSYNYCQALLVARLRIGPKFIRRPARGGNF